MDYLLTRIVHLTNITTSYATKWHQDGVLLFLLLLQAMHSVDLPGGQLFPTWGTVAAIGGPLQHVPPHHPSTSIKLCLTLRPHALDNFILEPMPDVLWQCDLLSIVERLALQLSE